VAIADGGGQADGPAVKPSVPNTTACAENCPAQAACSKGGKDAAVPGASTNDVGRGGAGRKRCAKLSVAIVVTSA